MVVSYSLSTSTRATCCSLRPGPHFRLHLVDLHSLIQPPGPVPVLMGGCILIRRLTAELCIRASDIGHGALSWKQHFEWTGRATIEFYLQGDEESRLDRTVSPLCDREAHSQLAKSQLGFLRHVVRPLFVELDAIDKQKKPM